MFSTEAIRLLREQWSGPQELAEELFAILQKNIPLTHGAPIDVRSSDSALPGFQVRVPGAPEGTVPFRLGGRDGTTASINVVGGNLVFTNDETGDPAGIDGITAVSAGGNAFMGTVVSGTGNTYQMLLDNGDTVQAIQQLIESSETIPAGAPAVVVLGEDNVYRMQYPTWIQ